MNNSKISIVTVCYNCVDVIEDTIVSIINQSYRNLEYIIIDGNSQDGTKEIINKYLNKITHFISEPDKGIYDAMNKGINLATGEWINFMNAGDRFYDSNTVQEFAKDLNDDTVIAYGNTLMRYKRGTIMSVPFPIEHLSWHMAFGHQSAFIRLTYHKEHLFNLEYKSSADFDFFHKAYRNDVKFQYINQIVADYEASSGLSSVNFLLVEKEMAHILDIQMTPLWYIHLYCRYFIDRLKRGIKALIPGRLLMAIMLMNLKRKNHNQL